jgi:formylglycine-generating enzyme required for sulfatase activity
MAKHPIERPTMAQLARELKQPRGGQLKQIVLQSGLSQSSTDAVPVRVTGSRVSRGLLAGGLAVALLGAMVLVGSRRFDWSRRARTGETAAVRLPAGSFTMGSTHGEIEAAQYWCQHASSKEPCPIEFFEREQPAHRVVVAAFWLDTTEVTNEQFARWLNSRPAVAVDSVYHRMVRENGITLADLHPMYGLSYQGGSFAPLPGYEHRPVTQVTWDAAAAYCRDHRQRLPTEAEWEYAARGARNQRFPWGFEEPRCDGVSIARGSGLGCPQPNIGPSDVGSSTQDRTPQGVYDLAGNVSEWVQDAFLERYAVCNEPCSNPVATVAADNNEALRVVRGGDFASVATFARATTRSRRPHGNPAGSIGFRCARSSAR